VLALVVSNMRPDGSHPERGRFVRDQVEALRRLQGIDVELYEFPPGGAALLGAARSLSAEYGGGGGGRRRRMRRVEGGRRARSVDVVHAHFGLTAWPALAASTRIRGLTVHGTDVRHPRTRLATGAVLPLIDLVAAPTAELARQLPGRAARGRAQVLPCGVDTERFRPIPRAQARLELGLDAEAPCLLFPADPARGGKRYDRAVALARALGGDPGAGGDATRAPVALHALGGVTPERVPLWVNAANAVVVPSEAEGFGLAVLEALACDVPVVATPVGVHPQALEGIDGALCAPVELERWRAVLALQLRDPDPRIAGRARAERFSAVHMAERLAQSWRELLDGGRL
jgi:teichuronic acid biosynthesis glycosyltransferase TuaC